MTFRLAELLAPLSVLADLGAGLPAETGLRCAVLGAQLAARLGLGRDEQAATYFAGMLRHLGCSSSAHEETVLMGDEQELRTSLASVDAGSPVALLQGARKGFGKRVGRAERARRVARFRARIALSLSGLSVAGRVQSTDRQSYRCGRARGPARLGWLHETRKEPAMSQKNIEIVARAYDAFARGDIAAVLDTFAERLDHFGVVSDGSWACHAAKLPRLSQHGARAPSFRSTG